jgi:hypothetical protein
LAYSFSTPIALITLALLVLAPELPLLEHPAAATASSAAVPVRARTRVRPETLPITDCPALVLMPVNIV